jgi:hypothetical protein
MLLPTTAEIQMTKSATAKNGPPFRHRPAISKTPSPKTTQGIIATQKPQSSTPSQLAPSAKSTIPNRTSTPWTVKAASRIYRTEAQRNNGQVPKGSFGAKAMSAATKGASHLKSPKK